MMRRRHRYQPHDWSQLESRLVLTHGGPLAPTLIGTLSANPHAGGRLARVIAQVNAAFNQFTEDYTQAEGAYLSSGTTQAAFKSFSAQRTNLLAQELTRIFGQLPGSFARLRKATPSISVVFQAFLNNRINGAPATSLRTILNSAEVVPPQGTSGAGATLYVLSATSAIQSARVATINAARYIANGVFPNS